MEFICLKKNYIKINEELKEARNLKKQLELEMINLQNANQQLNKDQDQLGTRQDMLKEKEDQQAKRIM